MQIRVGALFGVSNELDAFFVGAALPSVLLAIGSGVVSVFVVPRLPAGEMVGTAEAAGRVAVRGALAGAVVTVGLLVAAPAVVRIVGPGLSSEVAEQATTILRIYSLSIPGTAVAFVYSAYGYASGRIWTTGLSTGIYGATWLGLLFVPAFTGSVEGATWAGLIATGVQLVAAFAIASAGVARPWPRFRGLRVGRASLAALGAVLGAAIVARAGLLLDPLYGSLLPEGSVSQLAYATRIASLAIFVCGQGAAFTLLVLARERVGPESSAARTGMLAPLLLSVAGAAVLVVAAPPLGELILARGELSAADAREIGELLRLWAPGIIAFTLIFALDMTLYAELRARQVLSRALAGLAVNIAASGLFVLAFGIEGRPLGVLAGALLQLFLLVALMWDEPRVVALRNAATARVVALHAVAVAVATAGSYWLARELVSDQVGAMAAIAVAALITLGILRAYESGAPVGTPIAVGDELPEAELSGALSSPDRH